MSTGVEIQIVQESNKEDHNGLRVILNTSTPNAHITVISIEFEYKQPSSEVLKSMHEKEIRFPEKYNKNQIKIEMARYKKIKQETASLMESEIFPSHSQRWNVNIDQVFDLYDLLYGRTLSFYHFESKELFSYSYQIKLNHHIFEELSKQLSNFPILIENIKHNFERDMNNLMIARKIYFDSFVNFDENMSKTNVIKLDKADDILFDLRLKGNKNDQLKQIDTARQEIIELFHDISTNIEDREQYLLHQLDLKQSAIIARYKHDDTLKYEVKCDETWAYFPGYIIDFDNDTELYTIEYPNEWKATCQVEADIIRKIPSLPNYSNWKPNIGDEYEVKATSETNGEYGWWECHVKAMQNNDECLVAFNGFGDEHDDIIAVDFLRPKNTFDSLAKHENVRKVICELPVQLMTVWIIPNYKKWIDDDSLIEYKIDRMKINLMMIGLHDIVTTKKEIVKNKILEGVWLLVIGYLSKTNIPHDIQHLIHYFLCKIISSLDMIVEKKLN